MLIEQLRSSFCRSHKKKKIEEDQKQKKKRFKDKDKQYGGVETEGVVGYSKR